MGVTVTEKKRVYTCDRCGRNLKPNQWVFSVYTRSRYCLPGPRGCNR